MLQWMGGSRRKVTASRKSTHKRQKQYFEQRRRQHQHPFGLHAGYEEGENTHAQHHNEHRSLDVLSLFNLSSLPHDYNHASLNGREDPNADASQVSYVATKDPPTVLATTSTPVDSFQTQDARTPARYQEENVPQRKVPVKSPNAHIVFLGGTDNKSDDWKTETEGKLSLFDLLGEDGPKGNQGGARVHEAHVAFSVEGLGKVGMETPVHSTQRPEGYLSYAFSSPSNAGRKLKTSIHGMDDLKYEVEGIMQDSQVPLGCSYFDFPTRIEDSYSKQNRFLSASGDRMQLGCSGREGTSFGERNISYNIRNDNEDMWDARSTILEAHFPNQRDPHVSRNSWPCQIDGNSAEFWKYGIDEASPCPFEASHWPKKRAANRATEGLNILESPASKHKLSEDNYEFTIPKGPRHCSLETEFDFGYVTNNSGWSSFLTEDAKDNLSLSEESCSSATVSARGEVTSISPSSCMERHRMRHRNAFDGTEKDYPDKNIFTKREFKNKDDIWRGITSLGSRESARTTTAAESISPYNFNQLFREKTQTKENALFEERHASTDVNLGFSFVCLSSEAKRPSSCSEAWTEDRVYACSVPQSSADIKLPFDRSKYCSSFPFSPSGSVFSEKSTFGQTSSHLDYFDSPSWSKVEFGATKTDIWLDFVSKGRTADSFYDCVSEGEIFIPGLSAQQRVSKDGEHKSRFQVAEKEMLNGMSNVEFGATKTDICLDFVSKGRTAGSFYDCVSEGEKFIPGLSAQQRVSKDEEHKSRFQVGEKEMLNGMDMEATEVIDPEENCPKSMEANDGIMEMSSSVRMPEKSESSVDQKEYCPDAECPLPCPNDNEEIVKRVSGERNTVSEGHSTSLDPSSRVVMLGSYALQLLHVQNVPNEASKQTP